MLREIAKSEVELVLFSEMNEETPGIKWIKSKELYGVLVHGKCSGVFLRDLWAVNWRDQGCQRECGKRSISVCVDGTKLIALYQPLWNSDPEVFKEYREELSSQLQTRKARDILVIGGDFNATVGDIQVREADEAAGQFGLGKTNRAGRDLIDWCHEHQLCWVNSFFRHNNRGTWKNPAYHTWHELDGFVMKQSQRSRVARGIRTINTRCKLSDHEPKSMSCNLQWRSKGFGQRKPQAVINWDKLREQGPKTEYEKGVDEGLSAVQGEVDWKAKRLEKDITFAEFTEQLERISNGAPGNDGIRMDGIKCLSRNAKIALYNCITNLLGTSPSDSPDDCKEGWMIPLHKKVAKNCLDNYRGVCLLPLASRIKARLFATRIRRWAEEIGAMDENQNGFRSGRSTADATQVVLRVDEETRRVLGCCQQIDERRPGATLLDITEAYPRTNRQLLWRILERLGVTSSVLEIIEGLHEKTCYRVKGKEGLSENWRPQRGLREGCATSPILYNIYHTQAVRLAQKCGNKRQ